MSSLGLEEVSKEEPGLSEGRYVSDHDVTRWLLAVSLYLDTTWYLQPGNTRFPLRPLLGLPPLKVAEQRRPFCGRELASEVLWIE